MENFPNNYSTFEGSQSELNQVDETQFRDSENKTYYKLSKNPKTQFITSQLAAMIVPVASVYKEGNGFYSQSVLDHPDYKKIPAELENLYMSAEEETKFRSAPEDVYFMELIFEDYDHNNNSNNEGTILYDFHQATLDKDFNSQNPLHIKSQLIDLSQYRPELKQLVLEKVRKFKSLIEGEDGLNFISSLARKAEYNGSPEAIQEKLLSRCNLVLEESL